MMSALGLVISRAFRKAAPDPFVIAIVLTLLTAILAVAFGRTLPPWNEGRLVALLDAWRADDGLWQFLKFGMQMCLILVTGHALASASGVRAVIDRLAKIPRSTASAAGLVGLVACIGGIVNWGLGLIVGALLARDVGRALEARGIRAHYPLICAAGYMGLLVWHGGFSGSAPLTMTTVQGARAVQLQEYVGDGVPLTATIGSSLNLFVTGGLLVGIPLLLMMLAPRNEADLQPIDKFDVEVTERPASLRPATTLQRVERSWVIAWLLAIPLVLALIRHVGVSGLGRLDLNTINVAMMALGLILHGSPKAYMDAVTQGVRGCAGIIVQFPLYAGIMAMMKEAGLVEMIAEGFTRIGNETTIPLLSFLSAGVVNLFVPSGGGQWGIQGPVVLETGLSVGIPPGRMIMAVAYGDQLTNMLQPFWALPLLGITGVKARDIVGYTSVVMVFAGVWMGIGLLIF